MQAISSRAIRCHPPGALVLAVLFVVVGLAIPGYTQTVTSKKSSTDKKETSVTQLATAQVDSDPYKATVEIRAFHINVPEEQLVELRRRVAEPRGPAKSRSVMRRKASSSRPCRSWRTIGRPITTGERWRRS